MPLMSSKYISFMSRNWGKLGTSIPAFTLSTKPSTTSRSKTSAASEPLTRERSDPDFRAPSQITDSSTLRGRLPTSYERTMGAQQTFIFPEARSLQNWSRCSNS